MRTNWVHWNCKYGYEYRRRLKSRLKTIKRPGKQRAQRCDPTDRRTYRGTQGGQGYVWIGEGVAKWKEKNTRYSRLWDLSRRCQHRDRESSHEWYLIHALLRTTYLRTIFFFFHWSSPPLQSYSRFFPYQLSRNPTFSDDQPSCVLTPVSSTIVPTSHTPVLSSSTRSLPFFLNEVKV